MSVSIAQYGKSFNDYSFKKSHISMNPDFYVDLQGTTQL